MRQYFDAAKLDENGDVLETHELDRVNSREALKVAIKLYGRAAAGVRAYWHSQEHPNERRDYLPGVWSAKQMTKGKRK